MEITLPILWLSGYINLPLAIGIYALSHFHRHISHDSIGYHEIKTRNNVVEKKIGDITL